MKYWGWGYRFAVVGPVFVANLLGVTSCAGNANPSTSNIRPRIDEAVTTVVTATEKPNQETVTLRYSSRGFEKNLTPNDRILVEAALAKFAQLRGKSKKFSPNIWRTTHAEMSELLEQELDAQKSEALSQELDAVLAAWGLVPTGFRSHRAIIARFKEQSQALYLVSHRTITIPDDLLSSQLPSSLLHEVVHAYQDEFHRLGTRLTYDLGQSDRISAVHAFAEGEALLIELMAQLDADDSRLPSVEELRPGFARALEQAALPGILGRSLVAPYLDGYRFVTYLKKAGGFSLVDRVWSRGLTSTQELLHPERWVPQCLENNCAPALLISNFSVPPPLVSRSHFTYDDSIGEQGLRVLLEHTLSYSDASRLSAAYDSDRLSVFRHEDGRDVFWQLRVATPAETAELCSAITTTLSSKQPRAITPHCVGNDSAVMALSCAERDIGVSLRIHSDTWTGTAEVTACALLRRWLRTAFRASLVTN